MTSSILSWVGIAACLFGSAICSGLTLGYFSLSRIRLEVLANEGSRAAAGILALRKDANLLLATLLWSNVAVNVLLTLLSKQRLAGISAFFFSLIVITLFGEILPQAYFSRQALALGSRLVPVARALQFLMYPIAKPSAKLLDCIVGPEGLSRYAEQEIKTLLKIHVEAPDSEIGEVEATGATNFLSLDDVLSGEEGEVLDPQSVLEIPRQEGDVVLPTIEAAPKDPWLQKIHRSGKKWVVIIDRDGTPYLVLNADAFIRELLVDRRSIPLRHCHRPIIVTDPTVPLGDLISQFNVHPETHGDDVIDHDLILVWTDTEKRVITGADILGRLLRGIVQVGKRR